MSVVCGWDVGCNFGIIMAVSQDPLPNLVIFVIARYQQGSVSCCIRIKAKTQMVIAKQLRIRVVQENLSTKSKHIFDEVKGFNSLVDSLFFLRLYLGVS